MIIIWYYVVSHFQSTVHVFIHLVVIEGHEEGVDTDAQRDEQLDERIVNEGVNDLLEAEPAAGLAVPDADDVRPSEAERDQPLLQFRAVVFVVHFPWKIKKIGFKYYVIIWLGFFGWFGIFFFLKNWLLFGLGKKSDVLDRVSPRSSLFDYPL